MSVTVEFLSLPIVVRMVGGKTIQLAFAGQTVRGLIQEIATRHGPKLRDFLLDETGELDLVITAVLNKGARIPREQMDQPLKDGDHLTLMMLVGGG